MITFVDAVNALKNSVLRLEFRVDAAGNHEHLPVLCDQQVISVNLDRLRDVFALFRILAVGQYLRQLS